MQSFIWKCTYNCLTLKHIIHSPHNVMYVTQQHDKFNLENKKGSLTLSWSLFIIKLTVNPLVLELSTTSHTFQQINNQVNGNWANSNLSRFWTPLADSSFLTLETAADKSVLTQGPLTFAFQYHTLFSDCTKLNY